MAVKGTSTANTNSAPTETRVGQDASTAGKDANPLRVDCPVKNLEVPNCLYNRDDYAPSKAY